MEKLEQDFSKLRILCEISFPDGETVFLYGDSKKVLIEKICDKISKIENEEIILLREKEVIQWLFDDTSFLTEKTEFTSKVKEFEEKKKLEDEWGRNILKKKRPDLKLHQQWTNMFGQHLCEEYFLLTGKKSKSPAIKEGKQPDLETENCIVEVKTCTYYTTGTANEKIMGVPFKYANVPKLYGKPLRIFCLGGAEKASRFQYGNLEGEKTNPEQRILLDTYLSLQIEFVGFSELLKEII